MARRARRGGCCRISLRPRVVKRRCRADRPARREPRLQQLARAAVPPAGHRARHRHGGAAGAARAPAQPQPGRAAGRAHHALGRARALSAPLAGRPLVDGAAQHARVYLQLPPAGDPARRGVRARPAPTLPRTRAAARRGPASLAASHAGHGPVLGLDLQRLLRRRQRPAAARRRHRHAAGVARQPGAGHGRAGRGRGLEDDAVRRADRAGRPARGPRGADRGGAGGRPERLAASASRCAAAAHAVAARGSALPSRAGVRRVRHRLRDDRRRPRGLDRDGLAVRVPELRPLPRLRLRLRDRDARRAARRGRSHRRALCSPAAGGGAMRPLAVLLVAAWSLAPALWQLLTAVKPDAQITRVPTVYIPHPATAEHFVALWERKPFGLYLANSAWIGACATLLAVSLAALAASPLARMRRRGRDAVLLGFLLFAVFPPILLLFPLYEAVRALGWLNQPLALILPYAALSLPLAVWIVESGYRQIAEQIDEAAMLDGLGPLQRLLRIRLPLAAPSLATAAILVFIFCWNEFMLALTFMTRDERKTVTAGIASVSGASLYEIPWGQLSAAIVLATLPLVLLVLVFERRISSGLTSGAVKG